MSQTLASAGDYQAFIYALPDRYPSIERSTLVYIPLGARVGKAVGIVFFTSTFRRISSITAFQRQI